MFTRGEYQDKNDTYGVLVSHTKQEVEVILVSAGQVCSAFKATHDGTEYSFLNKKAKDLWKIIHGGISGCKSKNGSAVPFELGTSVMHEFTKSKNEYCIELYNGCLVGCDILTALDHMVKLSYVKDGTNFPQNIPYIKLTTQKQVSLENDFNANDVVVRSVEEIALEKNDITWLKKKKYYIVNDDEQAEKIFSFLDKYNGAIAYDTETTGLKINCFGKINSKYKKQLEEYNLAHPDEPLRADRLVGIIFCVEDNVSYYFPCFNRKFKNLYDTDTPTRQQVINNIKARYTIGDLATVSDEDSDMAQFIRNNPPEEWGSDVILMERVRDILQTKHIVAHNGSFEWKVGWHYEIDTNLKDDTMIMHQIMYKFRSTTSNRGEPSNLKFLSKLELGIDQWELGDFFPDFKEDTSGTVRSNSKARGTSKKQNSKIDFSYMTYEGTRVYAPTDGDATFLLYKKYKTDMLQNHREQEYIYNVEVIVACAIAYMEFYGIRINEDKITAVRDQTKAQIQCLISEIRQSVDYAGSNELEAYNNLKLRMDEFKKADNSGNEKERTEANLRTLEATDNLVKAINEDAEHQLNLASPAQVAELFYDVIGIPLQGEKRSVAKREIKGMLKMKNDDGSLKYPVVKMYSDYKKLDTLMTKFFDNLPYYMYPGGLIFCSFGQISTATGRMSCSKPNAQQFPKDITKIIEPRPGYVMLDADYSQIEYRVLTGMAGNEGLAKLFSDPDSDYHTLMASMMYNVPYASVTPKMRSDAKSFNFGIPYGMGLKSLAILLTGMSGPAQVDEAKEKYEKYFQNQPKTRKFFDTVKEQAQINGYTRTFWNRYRYYTFMDADGTVNNARKAAALRQAGNAVIQGTAADIFKISVARNFMYIRKNKLLGHLLIINMIHDEQLMEINAQKLNVQRILRDVGHNMQFNVEGFPPLYIGAGIGKAWGLAKGKMAEIHPNLLNELSTEADNIPIFHGKTEPVDTAEVLKYFDERVLDFRRRKVADYLLNPENYGKDLHPAIGNLLNLQFTYGHDKDAEGLKDDEFTLLCVEEFINHNNLEGVKAEYFKAQEENTEEPEEEDEDYDDDEDGVEEIEGDIETQYNLIDESDVVYGTSIHDIIKTFKYVELPSKKLLGLDVTDLYYKNREDMIDYLSAHVCEEDDEGAMEVTLLSNANVINRTGLYVNNIEENKLRACLGMK